MKMIPLRPAWRWLIVAGLVTGCQVDKLINTPHPTPTVATRLVLTAVPVTVAAGAPLGLAAEARDSSGALVPGFTGSFTAALVGNPVGGALQGTATVTSQGGIATFPDLAIDRAATGYTIRVSSGSLNSETSDSFTVVPGPPAKMVWAVQPTSVAGDSVIRPPPKLTVLDAFNNVTTNFSGAVTLAVGKDASSSHSVSLQGTTTASVSNGNVVFDGVRLDQPGQGYTLVAQVNGQVVSESAPFNVLDGPPPPSPTAPHLAFTIEPAAQLAGATMAPVEVTVLDSAGAVASGFAGTVALSIGANPGGGTLGGTTLVSAAAGVARFTTLMIDKAGQGYTLVASATGVTGATSTSFDITAPSPPPPPPPPAAKRVAFTVQPSGAQAGAPLGALRVSALDSSGTVVTAFTGTVSLAIGTNPGGGRLSGTTSTAATAGVATFSNLSIDKAGNGYTLTASSAGLTGATSVAFSITAPPPPPPPSATHLVFSGQPSSAETGASLGTVLVSALDASDVVVASFTGTITVAIGANPGGGALAGTMSAVASNGIATFGNLSIDKAGTGYTLTAAASGLTGATSAAFNITVPPPPPPPAATHLTFTAQPASADTGASLGSVRVSALDASNNVVTGFSGTISVAIGANPGGGTLAGATSAVATNGVATFANLSINKAGSGYTLTAGSAGLAGATSASFNVTTPPPPPPTATHLAFTLQPANADTGASLGNVRVSALDASNNVVTGFGGAIAVSIGNNPGGGTLAGTTTIVASGGVATFTNLRINKAGNGYTLVASSSGLAPATSGAFNITAPSPPPPPPPTATHLVFSAEPGGAETGASLGTVRVSALDASNNVVTTFSGTISVAIGNNPGGGSLGGTTSATASGGVATFANLSINAAGSGYTLVASSSGLSSATSASFTITAPPPPPPPPPTATHLVFTVQPSTVQVGSAMPTVVVSAVDDQGNVVTSFTGTITVAIAHDASLLGNASLGGTTSVSAVSGVARFSNLSINQLGLGYTLSASASGLAGATSASFAVVTL